ncbi:hypothetical protein G6F56_009559 [Rhizopus delemar]|nr:hypothetical protein G6F56_009559 [Rhizopus delemar]
MKPYEMNAYNEEDSRYNRNEGGPIRDNHRRERYSDARSPYNKRARNPKRKNEYDDDDKRGYAPSIEARVARERPCRTLFVRNIQYNITEKEVRAMFKRFGEIKDIFNLIDKRGMVFITFYDVRCSENAKNEMQGTTLCDRQIDVHYSLPKEEEEKAKCDRTKNQGTLLYTLKKSSTHLDDDKLHEYLSQFGQVKDIRIPNFKKAHLAQNYDRDCVAAYDGTIEKEYNGGWWDVAFFWDHPYKERVNAGKRERTDRKEREKTRYPRRDSRDDSREGSREGSPTNARYEQAQKAQHMLTALSYQQQPVYSPSFSAPQTYADHTPQPFVENTPQPFADNQVQQLLGLLVNK